MSHGRGGAPITGGISGGVLQCLRRRERVRCTPLVSHDAERTGLPRRQRLDAGVPRGGEATEGRRRQAWWGAGRQRRAERMEKQNGEKGGRGRWPTAFYGGSVARVERKKGQGVRGSTPHGREKGEERGSGGGCDGGQLRRPALALGRRARVAPLPRDRGGRRGTSDLARATDRRDR
jgi:hypothetical protein